MNMRTSIVITGDTEGAKRAVGDLNREMTALAQAAGGSVTDMNGAAEATGRMARASDGAGRSVQNAAAAAQGLGRDAQGARVAVGNLGRDVEALARSSSNLSELRGVSEATGRLKQEAAQLRGELEPLWATQQRANRELANAKRLLDAGAISADLYARKERAVAEALREATRAAQSGAASIGQRRAGFQQLSYNVGDVSQQLTQGINPMMVFGQQAGQTVQAIQLMYGSTNKFVNLLAGPYGAIIIGATTILGNLAMQFFQSKDASEEASKGMEAFAQRQLDISNFIDLTNGKLIELNRNLLANAVILRQGAIDKNNQVIRDAGQRAFAAARSARIVNPSGEDAIASERGGGAVRAGIDPALKAAIDSANGSVVRLDDNLRALAKKRPDLRPLITEVSNLAGSAIIASRDNARLAEEIGLVEGKTQGAARSTARLVETQVALLTATTPLEKARARYNIVLQRGAAAEKAGGVALEKYRSDLTAAAQAVNAAEAGERGAREGRRASTQATREAAKEARALKQANRELATDLAALEKKYDPVAAAAREYREELEKIARLKDAGKLDPGTAEEWSMRARATQLGDAIDMAGVRTDASKEERDLQQARDGVDDLVRSLETELAVLRELDPVQREMLQLRDRLAALPAEERERAEERIRGAIAQRNAAENVRDAAREAEMAQADLARTAVGALDAMIVGGEKASDVFKRLGQTIASAALEAALLGTGPFAALFGSGAKAAGGGGAAGTGFSGGFKTGMKEVFGGLSDDLGKLFGRTFGDKGAFTQGLGKALGQAGAGAAIGSMTGKPITNLLGIRGSQTGAQIGGAIGSFIPIPGGAIIGSVIGSALGGAFKKTKWGAVNVSGVDGDLSATGNSRKSKDAALGLAGGLQSGLKSIADMLGGSIGQFNVTVGQRHGDWRVRSGSGSLKVKKGAKDFNDDEAAATAYAIQLAISQGAVQGLSAAVQKALKSSTDVDQALQEAVKVQEIEVALGGIGSLVERSFRDFEKQAAERLRIARQYGFDVVKIEALNAKERMKLAEDLLEQQVGSLQRLVDEMTHGSMFEGSALDKREALLTAIASAKADLDNGVEGAADVLAGLFQELNAVSKDAYGTTGNFASDREAILDQARAAIAKANADIAAAQAKTSDPALVQTNAALDENNEQNAKMLAALQSQADLLRNGLVIAAGGGVSLADRARTNAV